MSLIRKTVRQLLREFWLPFILAVAWTTYAFWNKEPSVPAVVGVLGPAFFLVSWMTGQFFRVRKQEGVQTSLGVLEQRLEAIVGQLEHATREITAYTIGGDSWCYFAISMRDGDDRSVWIAMHQGTYPLYNVSAHIVDLAAFDVGLKIGDLSAGDSYEQIGDLIAHQARMVRTVDLGSGDARDFNVFFSARNGFFTQLIRLRQVGTRWSRATVVTANDGRTVLEEIDHDYPRDAAGKPEGL